jgi:hypothetical protein
VQYRTRRKTVAPGRSGAATQRPYQRDVRPTWLPDYASTTAMVGEIFPRASDPPIHGLHHASGQPRVRNKVTNTSLEEAAHEPAAVDPVCGMADGGGVGPVIRSGPSGYQASHGPLCQVLRKVVVDAARAGRGAAGGVGSVECRAVVTLHSLLMDHADGPCG